MGNVENTLTGLLIRAGKALVSSRDSLQCLDALTLALVPELADWCAIDLKGEDGELRRVAARHRDPGMRELILELGCVGTRNNGSHPLSRVLHTGKSERMTDVSGAGIGALAHEDAPLLAFGKLGLHSFLAAPVKARERTVGVLFLARSLPGQAFGEMELLVAEDIGVRAGFALENDRNISQPAREQHAAQEMRKQFDLLLESAGEGVYGIDNEGRCTFINGTALAMLGFERKELLGARPHALVHHTRPDGRPYPEAECPIADAIRKGEACRVDDEIFFRKDGSSFPVEFGAYPMLGGTGGLGAVVTFTDLSDRKRSQQVIRAYERRYRELFDHVSDGIYQTSPEGELLAANSALVKMLGYESEQELRALDVHSLYENPEDRHQLAAKLEREGLLRNEGFRLKTKSGQLISVVENARTVRNERGRVLYYEGALRPAP